MSGLVERLVNSVVSDDADADESALALELLIERERVYRPTPADDGGVREILGEELAAQRLTAQEITWAVNRLLEYVRSCESPPARALWPIVRSYESLVVPTFIALLKKIAPVPECSDAAAACLYSIGVTGIGSEHEPSSREAIEFAAQYGSPEIREQAQQWLDFHE